MAVRTLFDSSKAKLVWLLSSLLREQSMLTARYISCRRWKLSLCLWSLGVAIILQWYCIVRWHRRTDSGDASLAMLAPPAAAEKKEIALAPPFRRSVRLFNHTASLSTQSSSWVVFYHIYIPTQSTNRSDHARAIVRQQLDQIRHSYAADQQSKPLILYTTIGARILPEDMADWCQPELRCVNMQVLGSGLEDKTLRKVHAYCQHQSPYLNVTVSYLHNKGSYHSRNGANDWWRQHMTAAVTSRECYEATTQTSHNSSPPPCHVCGLLFQTIPSLHFPGNFWTAQCDYIRRLRPIAVFQTQLAATLDDMDKLSAMGQLTRNLYTSTANWTTGRGRYGAEQWVASHPSIRPCDVSTTPDLRYWQSSLESSAEEEFVWRMVPRRSLQDKHWQIQPRPDGAVLKRSASNRRLTDYHLLAGLLVRWWTLYGSLPAVDSWVWGAHFPDAQFWQGRVADIRASGRGGSNDTSFVQRLLPMDTVSALPTVETVALPQYEVGPWSVFYHVYLPDDRNVSHIIKEQLSTLEQSYAARALQTPLSVWYTLVGGLTSTADPVESECQLHSSLDCHRLQQVPDGNENLTLTALHEYCLENSEKSVLYIHSKGSYHESVENEHWRRHLLAAVTSDDCLESIRHSPVATVGNETATTCHVCGLQFYPIWAFFFPGNFFAGQCSYLGQLLPPRDYAVALTKTVQDMFVLKKEHLLQTGLYSPKKEGNLGLDRYAWEQWVGSHPSLQPCDLSPTADFRYWVKDQPRSDWKWSTAPRHSVEAPWYRVQTGKRDAILADPSRRMREYFLLAGMLFKWLHLYQQTPPADSWIWRWFPDGAEWRQGVQDYGGDVVRVLTQRYRDGMNLTLSELKT
jgi:hypothetical protein